jgi:2-iminobutanoate/2-iminopropanoate deaminase
MKQPVNTENSKSAHLLSAGIVSNGFIFVSGQVHCDDDLQLVGNTTEEKLAQVMKRIETILNAADATLDDIVKVVIYVTDMAMVPELNKTYPSYFKPPLPVREAVCVSALPLGANLEISVIAEQSQK